MRVLWSGCPSGRWKTCQGDKIFLELLRREKAFFSLKLRYAGDTLVEAVRDGKPLPLEEDR